MRSNPHIPYSTHYYEYSQLSVRINASVISIIQWELLTELNKPINEYYSQSGCVGPVVARLTSDREVCGSNNKYTGLT